MNQTSCEKTRSFYKVRLAQKLEERASLCVSTPSQVLVSQWFVPALLVYLVDISDQAEAFPALAEKLGLTLAEVVDILEMLQKEGFLELKSQGNVHISFNRLTSLVSSKRYLQGTLGTVIKRLESHFLDPNHWFLSHTLSLSAEAAHNLAEDYKQLLAKYIFGDTGQSKVVYQVSAQLIPVL